MDDYTPDTDEIRHHYLCCWGEEYRAGHERRFDTWLAEVIRAAKHDGWVEGHAAHPYFGVNPYEKEQ